ncbi:MAG: PBP1A family penicillin-binding protein [Desulfobacterales bacterium]|nr:PBP1A family penicillin-binding protein [Desulfobacterales bacterium]
MGRRPLSLKNPYVLLILFVISIFVGVFLGGIIALFYDLPEIRELENFEPSAVSSVFSRNHILLAEFFIQKRTPIKLSDMPDHLIQAVLVTEDRQFYSHSGINIKAIIRALIKDILAGAFVEGASTLTQQLAKTLFLTPEKNIRRKIKEAILAFQLERRYTKSELLEFYLNQIYLGSGAYGVASAAKIYFNKSVQQLTLAECALIAGLPKSPATYSPLINIEKSVKRRNSVLKQMEITGIIDQKNYELAINETVSLPKDEETNLQAPYFVDFIKKDIEEQIGTARLYKGGVNIMTSLDDILQKRAEEAVFQGMNAMRLRMDAHHIQHATLQCALVAIDVNSGEILALIGGLNYKQTQFNRATDALRQPGSAFKPIIYAYAIENGYSQNSMVLDAPLSYKMGRTEKYWEPENYTKTFLGEIALRKALALSQNTPVIRLLETLGTKNIIEFARNLGIRTSLKPNLSLALGTSETTLLDLTSAYAVFANKGEGIQPYGWTKVIDRSGNSICQFKLKRQVVMSRVSAAIITDMLKAVIQEGTAKKAKELKREIAGKTGTTTNCKDALFVGFSPRVALGVWIGKDDHQPLGKNETGSAAALPIWIEVMKTILHDYPLDYFDIPDEVVSLKMDPDTGQMLPMDSSHGVHALFKKN